MSSSLPGVLKLRLSLVQLGFGLIKADPGFFELGLVLLKFNSELFLGGAHCGGDLLRDFEELASSLLKRLQLATEGKHTREKSALLLLFFFPKDRKFQIN